MSALQTIQISTNTLRETLKGEGRGAEGDGKAFLQALLDSEYAADGEITGEELVRFLQARGGKDLPALGELLPQMLAMDATEPAPQTPVPDTAEGPAQDPEQIVAGLLAMIEGPARADTRVGGSAGLEGFLKSGGNQSLNAAQLREALMQGMAAARAADADGAEKLKLDDFQAALQRLGGNAASTTVQAGPDTSGTRALPTLQINTPPGQPGWGQAVGEKVVWMVRQEVQNARIQLNPPGMGPLEVSVNIQDDKASVSFTAHHAVTRDALQADVARLRQMLSDNGFENVDVDVAHDSDGGRYQAGDAEAHGEGGSRGQGGGDAEAGAEQVGALELDNRSGNGLIDHYA